MIIAAERVWKKHLGVEVEITSGLEDKHMAGSYHPFGYAVDFGTKDKKGRQVGDPIRKVLVIDLLIELKKELKKLNYGPAEVIINRYDVVPKRDHIHTEYEVDKW